MEQRGFLLIADITGYTVYLTRSELDHAKGTLTDLLELLVEHTRPPLVISRLEGDAVFSFALGDRALSGQTFLETLEDTYVAFRRAIDLMVLNNTCRCNACANVESLDLKFFLHHGTFVSQRIGEYDELVGTDVNLVHRLLKNTVRSETGITAYLLCTQAAVDALGLSDETATMVASTQALDQLGEVRVWVKDMHPVFEARRHLERIVIPPDQVLVSGSVEVAMPPAVVWDYLHTPEFRNVLMGSDRTEVVDRGGGRIGPGTGFQCYHGDKLLPQVVLEWHPFERALIDQFIPLPVGTARALLDFRLEETGGGTRLTQSIARVSGPWPARLIVSTMLRMASKQTQADLEAFRDRIEQDFASRIGSPVVVTPSPDEIGAAIADSLDTG